MKISILHPSRQRPVYGIAAAQRILGAVSGKHDIEYIMGVRKSDPCLKAYRDGLASEYLPVRLVEDDAEGSGKAANFIAAMATGDLFIIWSDDSFVPQGWDDLLATAAKRAKTKAFVIAVSNNVRTDELLTLQILSKPFYDLFGYVFYPGYHAMYADNDFTDRAYGLGVVVEARDLIFKQDHYTAGGHIPYDDTYAYENAPEHYAAGKVLLKQRRARDFDMADIRKRLA